MRVHDGKMYTASSDNSVGVVTLDMDGRGEARHVMRLKGHEDRVRAALIVFFAAFGVLVR